MDVDSLNKEKKDAMKLIQGVDGSGNRNRYAKNVPQDEEELDFLIDGWNE